MSRTILVWFRNDLRLHDNEILVRALENGNRIVPVYCFDPRHYLFSAFGTRKTGLNRASFIQENVRALRESFRRFGGDLHVVYGRPEEVLPELCRTYAVEEVYHHREVADEETHVSGAVEAALWKLQINLRHFIGHTLYHKEDLPFPIKDIPDSFSVFRKKAERESSVRPQLSPPDTIRFPETGIQASEIPSLTELGFDPAELAGLVPDRFTGGEEVALERMHEFLSQESPLDSDSGLSPYIASGALSPNTFYHALLEAPAFATNKKKLEPQLLRLLWRDYYRFMFKKHGNAFFQEAGLTGKAPERSLDLVDEELVFQQWAKGTTEEPAINQAMRQLADTGYLPGRMRSIVATYLVHHLGVHWLRGAAWFEEKLIDYNPASNYGNWAHIAGVGSSAKDNKPLDIKKILT